MRPRRGAVPARRVAGARAPLVREHARLAYPIGVYYTMEPRLVAPVGVLSPGRYWLKLTVDTDREDLEPSVVLPAPVVHDSVLVRIP